MKKTIPILLAFLLAASLYSCKKEDGGNQGNTNTDIDIIDTEETAFTVADVANDLLENASFPAMYTLSSAEAELQFGISSDDVSELYAATADEYPGIERIFIAKLSENADKKAAKESLEAYLEALKAEYIDYLPTEYAKAKNVSVYESGDYICLVIAEDSTAALNIVKNYIK